MSPVEKLASCAVVLLFATPALGQSAPSGPHPRIWLDTATLSGLSAEASGPNGPMSRARARCHAARTSPGQYSSGGWQGFEFVTTLSSCLVAWKAANDADDLTTAIQYWKVLLDDYHEVGDAAGGDDVVSHDSGYAMRTFAPYSALAYDWLHDAPGVDAALLSHARDRFAAWMNWYEEHGYLPHMPGANYQAGYVFAATLIAIAEGGEAGATGDAHWATVRDILWGKDMKQALEADGVLGGGDWPEGWEYGSLSVAEYALAARALSENGLEVPGAGDWADALARRFRHSLTPATRRMFVGGDTDVHTANMAPPSGPLIAVIAGPAGTESKSWAAKWRSELDVDDENPLFDALASARQVAPADFPSDAPRHHRAGGTGSFYVRSDWSPAASWSVLGCSRRVVADHQHNDAGNWVLSRGADDLVVDPSPYGSLSTLSSNAPAVDSDVMPSGYSPSQGDWGETTGFRWARQLASGTSVARCEYSDQFRFDEKPSDVTTAIRDFVWVPVAGNVTLVLLDRVVTGDADRALHLRVRTPTTLMLEGDVARASVGASALFVRRLEPESGQASVREMPKASECEASQRDSCDGSRLDAGMEYLLDVPGPVADAVHVIDALEVGATVPTARSDAGEGYRTVSFERSGKGVVVVTSDTASAAGDSFGYRTAAGGDALHVVLDVPSGSNGLVDVASVRQGSECVVDVTPHDGATGGYDGRPLIVGLTADCSVLAQGEEPSGGAGGSVAVKPDDVSGGCGCRTRVERRGSLAAVVALGLFGWWLARRRSPGLGR
jgi:hypothetical protein